MALRKNLLHIIPNDGFYKGIMQIKTSQRLSKNPVKDKLSCFDLRYGNGAVEALTVAQNGAITKLVFNDEVSKLCTTLNLFN